MDTRMTADDVIVRIKSMHDRGESLNKKSVKKSHPELMQSALYYYPSWDHALERTGVRV